MLSRLPPRLGVTALLLILVLSGCGKSQDSGAKPQAAAESEPKLTELNNRGVGLMGKFEYDKALEVFEQLVRENPQWNDAQINLAIATLNRQHEGDEQAALKILDEVLARDPQSLRAHYTSGLLRLYLESPTEALKHFQLVAEADPKDAYAAYYTAQCLAQERKYEDALKWYDKAINIDPYLRSAYYAAAQAARAAGRSDQAKTLLDEFQKLEKNPRARLVEFKYTCMGPKGMALAVGEAQREPSPLPEGPVFLDPVPLLTNGDQFKWKSPRDDRPVSITAVDIDMDGDIDVFIAGAVDDAKVHNAVCINNGDGTFTMDANHALASIPNVNAALWGDYDNDGLTDVYLTRRGPNMLWRQTNSLSFSVEGEGRGEGAGNGSASTKPDAPSLQPSPKGRGGAWTDVTASTGTANGEFDTVDGAMVDFDHDGDLDIFCVNFDGPNELLNNNLDGTFRPIAQEQGIAGPGTGSIQVLPVDLDSDRDLDIIVLNKQPPHDVWVNDRLWSYREAEEFESLRQSPLDAMVSGDPNGVGDVKLYAATQRPTGFERAARFEFKKDASGSWQKDVLPDPPDWGRGASKRYFGTPTIAMRDVDGSGAASLLLFENDGMSQWRTQDGFLTGGLHHEQGVFNGWNVVEFWNALGPAIVAVSNNGPVVWRPGPGRFPFATLTFSGRKDNDTMRSNASGIGTHFAARIDSKWVIGDTLRNSSGPGQSLQPVAIGLGGHDKIDFIEIDWSDGVFQSEIDLHAGKLHEIVETQRQLSSCPVLFAWNGEKFEFITDLLGVGGIGYMTAPGSYAPSRPWENLLLPADALEPRDGRFVLKLSEPMEEACYLDSAKLVAYDLPPGMNMTVDDRMSILGPEPTGEVKFYRDLLLPVQVKNDHRLDVTADVREADLKAADVGEVDPRFIGRLKSDQVLTIEFDQPLTSSLSLSGGVEGEGRGEGVQIDGSVQPSPPAPLPGGEGSLLLIIDGWVEYPYSQTMFAAWQAGSDGEYRAPTVEARDGEGRWIVVLEQFGYPAGMPRQMSVPLPAEKIPQGCTALRITTNQEIYFDRIAVAFAQPGEDVLRHELPIVEARLNQSGFAKRDTFDQRRPYYDYTERTPFWDTRYQRGMYTAIGPCTELVNAQDEAMAIFGPGEEIHMEFEANLPPVRDGWTRRFVLETRGWCKDMDLFTKDGETIGPLPGETSPFREILHERYNTRFESGRSVQGQ